ncbi:c-type cytochrome [Betaproteobacteria bacterium SCN1]|jgi:cytochrome c553|nr:c-type cytochrome [Betaproteobacteria bacterium SCN1]
MDWKSAVKYRLIVRLFCLAAWAALPSAHAGGAEPPAAVLHERLTRLAASPAELPAALRRGQAAASVCRHCHGPGGNSALPEVPNLASQNADYLLEQMNKFVLGTRKSSDFMTGMIRALTPEERVDIALFLSRQPVAYAPAARGSDAGRALFGQLCAKCHGDAAAGSHRIPRLAGQQMKYLEDSLKRYRSGMGERLDPMMAAYTRNLEDTDILALAAHLAALRP